MDNAIHNALSFPTAVPVSFPLRSGIRGTPRPYKQLKINNSIKYHLYSILHPLYFVPKILYTKNLLHRLIIVSAILLILLIIWGGYRLYLHHTRLRRRLNLILEAFDHADTSIRFPVSADPEINPILNRITQNLSDLRSQIICAEKFHETVLRDISTGVIIAQPTGHILRATPSALRLLDRSVITHLNALSDSWPELTDLLTPLRPGIDATVRNLAVKTSAFTSSPDKHQPEPSTPASILSTSPSIKNRSILSPSSLIIITIDDISSQLEAANVNTWMEMSRILTHEIMNGIAPVVSIADTLLTRYAPKQTTPEPLNQNLIDGLQAICESTRGLSDFVTRYRALTHIPTPEPTTFPLLAFLRQTIALASQPDAESSTSAPAPSIKLHISGPTSSTHSPEPTIPTATSTADLPVEPTLTTDRDQLRQVLLNIIKNAIEAHAHNITLRLTATPGRTIIIIENDGDPIPSDIASHIFTPYFTTKTTGSGIGLSISRRLIIANGGTLTLTTSTDTNTRFTITLPTPHIHPHID